MSLPTYAKFIKNGVTVAVGFCNIGWTVSDDGLISAIFEAYSDAKITFTSGCNKLQAYQFGTLEDFKTFDFVYVYNLKVPKSIVDEIVLGSIHQKKFSDLFHSGAFAADEAEYIAIMSNTKSMINDLIAKNEPRNPSIPIH